jgi:excisionase family DNA binding protein
MAGSKHSKLLNNAELAAFIADPTWPIPLPPLLTAHQVAKALTVSVHTVYGWSSQGLLDSCKVSVGKHRRFVRDKLFDLIINGRLHGD